MGGYIGEYEGDYYRGYKGDTRSLDYSLSCILGHRVSTRQLLMQTGSGFLQVSFHNVHMSNDLNSLRGVIPGITWGSIIGVTEGDARSLDCGSYTSVTVTIP